MAFYSERTFRGGLLFGRGLSKAPGRLNTKRGHPLCFLSIEGPNRRSLDAHTLGVLVPSERRSHGPCQPGTRKKNTERNHIRLADNGRFPDFFFLTTHPPQTWPPACIGLLLTSDFLSTGGTSTEEESNRVQPRLPAPSCCLGAIQQPFLHPITSHMQYSLLYIYMVYIGQNAKSPPPCHQLFDLFYT